MSDVSDIFDLDETPGSSWHSMPPRSQLYNIEPYTAAGLQREGLLSYIIRLARAHSVNPRHLVKHVFTRVDGLLVQICDHTFFSKSIGTANGLGKYAVLLSDTANILTSRNDLAGLTMLPWSEIIPEQSAGFLAKNPRWCPYCFAEQIDRLGETYSPLAWSFSLYRSCIQHSCELLERCFHCGQFQAFLPAYPDAARCSHCNKSLIDVQLPAPEAFSSKSRDANKFQVEDAIAEMINRHADIEAETGHENFRRSLRLLVQSSCSGNQAAFCRIFEWDMWALNGWLKRNERISFPKLIQLSLQFSSSPVDLCRADYEPPMHCRGTTGNAPWPDFPPRAKKPLLSKKEVAELKKAIQEKIDAAQILPSLRELGDSFGVSRSTLKYWFPDLCAKICERRKELLTADLASARKVREEIVTREVQSLIDTGIAPTRRKVDSRLKPYGLALTRPELNTIYKAMLQRP